MKPVSTSYWSLPATALITPSVTLDTNKREGDELGDQREGEKGCCRTLMQDESLMNKDDIFTSPLP